MNSNGTVSIQEWKHLQSLNSHHINLRIYDVKWVELCKTTKQLTFATASYLMRPDQVVRNTIPSAIARWCGLLFPCEDDFQFDTCYAVCIAPYDDASGFGFWVRAEVDRSTYGGVFLVFAYFRSGGRPKEILFARSSSNSPTLSVIGTAFFSFRLTSSPVSSWKVEIYFWKFGVPYLLNPYN